MGVRDKVPTDLRGQGGFTLVELLVVLLVIGILAGIAIPALLGQTANADDAGAKRQARTAAKAAEVIGVADGAYTAVTLTALRRTESSLNDKSTATLQAPVTTAASYKVGSRAIATGDIFYIARDIAGDWTRTCKVAQPSKAGGCTHLVGRNGTW